jgi:hypothetical protein
MTTERLKELLAKATPGPWGYQPKVPGAKMWFFIVGNREGNNAEVDIGDIRGGIPTAEANAALIVEAVNSLPALIARIEEVEAALWPFAEAFEANSTDGPCLTEADIRAMHEAVDVQAFRVAARVLTPNQRGDNG